MAGRLTSHESINSNSCSRTVRLQPRQVTLCSCNTPAPLLTPPELPHPGKMLKGLEEECSYRTLKYSPRKGKQTAPLGQCRSLTSSLGLLSLKAQGSQGSLNSWGSDLFEEVAYRLRLSHHPHLTCLCSGPPSFKFPRVLFCCY